ncbi:MAG TPA: protease pro-enzyme activation domain-containing protein [Terriglobales bacterium]|nr:protease pro-enzyme activation domain-containing protein [Terriglobales bacterium]
MLLQLKRSPEQEQALQQFIDELHTKGSPNFHHWLTAQEFGERFGTAKPDLDAVSGWLESHGFKVNVVYPNGMVMDFSGTAAQVRKAFQTEIHRLEVRGEKHIGNMSDPRIPAALAPVVAGVVSLHDFRPHTMYKMRRPKAQFTFTDSLGGTNYAVVPADLATIYNLNPLFSAGNSGQGQTIVLIEDTDVFSASDWNSFRQTLGLAGYTSASFTSVHPAPSSGPNNCGAPGVIAPNDAEAILDAEWASAAAPSAAIEMAACADTTTTFGGLIAVQNLINASTAPPSIMSISYGQCETVNGAAANAAFNSTYRQAVAEGVSVFVAAGDSGAAGCDNSVAEATHGIGVNAFASTAYNVAVGGTDFSDTYNNTNATYWNSSNTTSFGSAISYVPEIPWNDSCAGLLFSTYEGYSPTYGSTSLCTDPSLGPFVLSTVAGGGGPSQCATGAPSTAGVVGGSCAGWPKPSWQAVLGNPNDGVRDTPDVSLFAADGLWSHFYVFCWSDTANGGAACGSDPSAWSGAGGTSFASPIMAGIQALINQKAGGPQGNPAPAYYQLAAAEYGSSGSSSCNSSNGNTVSSSCIFYDVTFGDMDVDCVGPNCYLGGGSVGVLSTSNSAFSPAYGTTVGWDFATGIGTVNAANLVNNWPGSATQPSFILSASPGSLALLQGGSGSTTITIQPLNGFSGSVNLAASGLPSGVSASFVTNPATTTSVLNISATRTATIGTFTVTVTGTSGSLTSKTTFTVTVNPVGDYTLSASPSSLSIVAGTSGTSTITVTPQNGFNGSVSLFASGLPSGVTASFSTNPATATSTLTLTASRTATTGTVTVTITGASGNLSHTTVITLTVASPPNFTLSASPSSLTVTQGTSGTTSITITPQNGFNGNVSLSASGLPSGVTASFSPNPATATSTLTLTASGTATIGTVNVTVTGTSGSLAHTTSFALTVRPLPAVATFVATDTVTQGSWHGVYGADGYSVANDSQSIPNYASFAVQNQLNWTYTSSTSDPRALQTGSNTGRIAAAWYGSSFNFDVNFTDGNLHPFALYAVDWDARGRSETIQVVDANTNAVLDTHSLSNFSNGVYLVWRLSGHVKIIVTVTGGVNAVVSGVFFGGASGSSTETVSVSPQNVSLTASQQQQFTAFVSATANQAVTWSIASVSPSTAASGSISVAGLYTAPAVVTAAQVTIKATSADGTASGNAKVNLIVPAVASFVATDTVTQGSWHGVYGADGYSVANDSQSIPNYASFAVQNQANWTYTSSTSDPRALQTGSNTGRIAAVWYGSSFDFDMNFTDGNLHPFALYAVDWDARGRSETIQVVDANTNAVLDTRSLSNFSNGVYLLWRLSGHVKINVTVTGGVNAVVSGVFFN